MKLPNKVICYKESIISKFPIILNILVNQPYSVSELYVLVKNKIESVEEYLCILDCLFALDKIAFDNKMEMVYYVV